MRALFGAAAVVLALAVTGCGSGSEPSGQSMDPTGSWGQSDPGQPNLELESDGTFSGTDGCNRLGGSWKADGAEVVFSQVRTTLMACEDVDTWLSALATATVTSDALTVFDEGGAEIGSLARG